MNWIIARLKEPSTYAGLAAITAAVMPQAGIDAGTLQAIGAGVLALVAIIVREKGG